LRLKQYGLEQQLRDLKYKLENKNLKTNSEKKVRAEVKSLEQELITFIQTNELTREPLREDPAITD
jgi:hypothetical protein